MWNIIFWWETYNQLVYPATIITMFILQIPCNLNMLNTYVHFDYSRIKVRVLIKDLQLISPIVFTDPC